MTMPLLEGLDGINKMSKSLGNYIGINEPADAQFGKLMSISDELMWRYFELLSFRPLAEIAALRKAVAEGRNPRDVKFELGVELVDRFHGGGAGVRARDVFVARFQQGHVPEDIERITLTTGGTPQRLANVLKNAGLVASTWIAVSAIRSDAANMPSGGVSDWLRKSSMSAPPTSEAKCVGASTSTMSSRMRIAAFAPSTSS